MANRKAVRVYRWRSPSQHGNFGDEITLPIIERLFGLKAVASPMPAADLLGAGSILGGWAKMSPSRQLLQRLLARRSRDLHVWGTGLMLPGEIKWPQRLHVHAVRGRLTASNLGVDSVLADPGILANLLIEGPKHKQWSVGLVPHHADTDLVTRSVPIPSGWRVIDPEWPVDEVLANIAGCELLVSSSLHGLIAADSFGIPCVRLSTSRSIYGASDFKFQDYASSRSAEFNEPLTYNQIVELGLDQVATTATKAGREIEAWQKELIDVFPFR